jgi:hypothetical protein
MNLEGAAQPGFVVMFLVAAVVGLFGSTQTAEAAGELFDTADRSTDVDWVANNIVTPGVDLCKENGHQTEPVPPDTNYSHTFTNLDWINTTYDSTYLETAIVLGYEGGETRKVVWSQKGSVYGKHCRSNHAVPTPWIPSINGTDPDGNSQSTGFDKNSGDSFNVTSDSLKFRIFEISRDEIQIQVRQD